MKVVKIINTAGREIYINIDSVNYVCTDIMNPSLTQIHLNNTFQMVKGTVEEVLSLIKGNK